VFHFCRRVEYDIWFCDECGISFLRPTLKWCSECDTSMHEQLMEENVLPLEVLGSGEDPNMDGEEQGFFFVS
jgi:hypothetical protein